jgi:hypothetical protein
MSEDLTEKVKSLQALLLSRATGGYPDEDEYAVLRRELMGDPSVKYLLPDLVSKYRTLPDWWSFIKHEFGRYEERRAYLSTQFDRVFRALEGEYVLPSEDSMAEVLALLSWGQVQNHWQKGLDRKDTDPEGAITIARTLIESACKHILDDCGVRYSNKEDLPKLYTMTVEQLDLAPHQQSTEIMRQILGGCKTVVDGMGALRNQIGDAHGRGQNSPEIDPCYAELSLNLAGALVTFLMRKADARIRTNVQ